MKVNLLKIEEWERNRSRGFMKRMKEAWYDVYKNSTLSPQTLTDNAARFFKDILLLNVITVRNGNDKVEVKKTLRRMKTMRKKS